MNTEYFYEFLTLCDTRNYAEAADLLHVSPSTLSRHIQNLEAELGVPLLIRTPKEVALTEFGTAFLPFAEELNGSLERMQHAIKRMSTQKQLLRIAPQYLADDLFVAFEEYDKRTAILKVENKGFREHVVNMLHRREIDLGIIMSSDPHDGLTYLPYEEERSVVVMPSYHPFANRSSLSIKDLKDEEFVAFSRDYRGSESLISLCEAAGFKPKIKCAVKRGVEMMQQVRHGGVAIMLSKTLKNLPSGLTTVPLSDSRVHTVCLAYLDDDALPDAARRFIRFTQEVWPTLKEAAAEND